MKHSYLRWACGLLAALLLLLGGTAAVTYTVDPCLYYRMPDQWQPVFFNERYQAAGLVKNVKADTVLIGSSMAANYRAGDIGEAFGGTGLRVTLPDGYFQEFDQVMDLLFRSQNPKQVVFGLDANILMRDDSGVGDSMPKYLYDRNPFNDVKYLLSKDTLYYCAYVQKANTVWNSGQTLDEGFTWDKGIWWSRQTALGAYERPELAAKAMPEDAFFRDVDRNLAVVESWIAEHPETQFDIFLPPYSILYWDKTARQGRTDAVFAALERTCRELTELENVRLFGFLFDREIVENLDNYCDYVHHSGEVSHKLLGKLAAGEEQLTAENWQETLANWKAFVVHYDYEKFWNGGEEPAV